MGQVRTVERVETVETVGGVAAQSFGVECPRGLARLVSPSGAPSWPQCRLDGDVGFMERGRVRKRHQHAGFVLGERLGRDLRSREGGVFEGCSWSEFRDCVGAGLERWRLFRV